jgi:rubrerythrin
MRDSWGRAPVAVNAPPALSRSDTASQRMEQTEARLPAPHDGRVIVPERGSALRKLAEDDSSRKRFLKMVGGTGAASAFALLLAACGDDDEETAEEVAPEEGAGKDLDILNYALTLEFLEAKLYRDVLDSGVIKDETLAQLATTFGEHEQEHVDALAATVEQMGGTPAEDPNGDFDSVIDGGAEEVLAVAARVENVGAAAYLNEAGSIQSPEVLAAALSIHTVEGHHAAALNDAAGLEFTGEDQFEGSIPDGAFAAPADRATVMKEIEPFLPRGGGSQ